MPTGRLRTSSITAIIYPTKNLDRFIDKVVNRLSGRDVNPHVVDLALGIDFLNRVAGVIEPLLVAVRDDDFLAAFAREGDCCCLADTLVASVSVDIQRGCDDRMGSRGAPLPAPVMRATPGKRDIVND